MTSEADLQEGDYRLQTYIFLSLVLAMPTLLWPLFLWIAPDPSFDALVITRWKLSACILLLAAIVADSIFSGAPSYGRATVQILWVVAAVLIIIVAQRSANGIYLVAMLFALHSLRSMVPLWHGRAHWWHWTAWIRDCSAALALFVWMAYLSV